MYSRALSHGLWSSEPQSGTTGDILHLTVARFSHRDALIVPHQQYHITYGQLWSEVSAVARGLLARGISRGDRVGLWCSCSHRSVLMQLAIARVGAVLVTFDSRGRSDMAEQISLSQVSVLVIDKRFRAVLGFSPMHEVLLRCPVLHDILVVEDDWKEFLELGKRIDEDALRISLSSALADEVCNVQVVTGTPPMVNSYSHRTIISGSFFAESSQCHDDDDRVFLREPLVHCLSTVVETSRCILFGACLVILKAE